MSLDHSHVKEIKRLTEENLQLQRFLDKYKDAMTAAKKRIEKLHLSLDSKVQTFVRVSTVSNFRRSLLYIVAGRAAGDWALNSYYSSARYLLYESLQFSGLTPGFN